MTGVPLAAAAAGRRRVFGPRPVIPTMTTTSHTAPDESAFTASVHRHRRELHIHCYRMLGSFEESEDAV